MSIDQAKLGQHVSELMEEIEKDPDIPDDAQIGRMMTIVEVVGNNGGYANIRMRSNARPYVALGFLEVAKTLQMKAMGG